MSIDMILRKTKITKKGIQWDVLRKDTGEKLADDVVTAIATALAKLASQGFSGHPWRMFDEQGRLLMSGAKIKAKAAQ